MKLKLTLFIHIIVHVSSAACCFCNLIKKLSTFPTSPFQPFAIKISFFTIQLKPIEKKIKSYPTSYFSEIHYTTLHTSCWLQHSYAALCISVPMKQTWLFLYDLIFFVIYRPLYQTHNRTTSVNHLLWLIGFVLRIA